MNTPDLKSARILAITGPHATAVAQAHRRRRTILDVSDATLPLHLPDIDTTLNTWGDVTLAGESFHIPATLAPHTAHLDTTGMNMRTFSTYCPVFTGFYNTVFDESESFVDYELCDEESFRENYPDLAEVPYQFIIENFWEYVDYGAANRAVAEAVLANLPDLFPDNFHMSTEFEELRSPQEYDFANDSIDCKITLDVHALQDYLSKYQEEFDVFLADRYTSRSGFIPSYPNTMEEWADDTENFTALDGHYCGAILDFIAHNEHDDPQMDLYYKANGSEAFSNAANVDIARLIECYQETQEA
jgi:hypothetical protein